ncbi:MAG TPA: glycine cleavage system aminomethyltransferase GcvT [Candidatus Omnitrophica bacterium]|nr:MAG: glycine cleavage system protein T [Omnitrophica WOR_2 bacterium GWA2_45_18]OGX21762.1 MAG: glycine cleavage system protein T [Omnitrophica WOR_2 bacterium GWC2_45_7]HBR15309.1 glycine cleavage system aminomethyltransferase GcvT [Candidatus Omnitrophota bacterium]
MITQESLKKTPLYDEQLASGARMIPFGGWEMPVQFEGILAEYDQTRTRAAIFDTSHMGEFLVEGDAGVCGLDRIVTMSLADMPIKTGRYGMILNERGGIIDDLIVFRVDQQKWFIVVNGSTTHNDAEHFKRHLKAQALFKDVSTQTGKLDIQGPLSRDVLSGLVKDISKLDYYTFDYFDLLGDQVLISRTGYTGELGYEIYCPWNMARTLWQRLMEDKRLKAAGLGARDLLRLEMGYSLYGHELNEDISPLEAGLSRFINFEKDFIGKEALLKQREIGGQRKIVGFVSDNRRSPRAGHKIYSEEKAEIGFVTSGAFSPELKKGIGLGMVAYDRGTKGAVISFGDESNRVPAIITERIFYKKGSLKDY